MVSAKLWMRNYKDAFNCINRTAEKENNVRFYEDSYRNVQ